MRQARHRLAPAPVGPLARWLLIAAMAVMAAQGCAKPKDKSAALEDPFTPGVYPQIAALDGLARSLTFSSPTVSTNQQRVVITVPVRLTEHAAPRHIEYKFEFFEKDGRPAMHQPDWQAVRLTPGTRRYLQGSSQTQSARHWRLLLRPSPHHADPDETAPPVLPALPEIPSNTLPR